MVTFGLFWKHDLLRKHCFSYFWTPWEKLGYFLSQHLVTLPTAFGIGSPAFGIGSPVSPSMFFWYSTNLPSSVRSSSQCNQKWIKPKGKQWHECTKLWQAKIFRWLKHHSTGLTPPRSISSRWKKFFSIILYLLTDRRFLLKFKPF